MDKSFMCDCQGHIIRVTYDKPDKTLGRCIVGVSIFDKFSDKGRKLKNPKLIADVVLMNNAYPNELTKFVSFFKILVKRIELDGKKEFKL